MINRSIYFNYAGVAPLSLSLGWQLMKFFLHFYFLGPRSALLKYEKWIPLLYRELARLLNCQAADFCLVKNTTEGIILAAESLPLQTGDEILVMGCEYPANLIPWLKKRNDGIDVRVIDGENSEIAYRQLLTSISGRTRAIAVSWVQFSDGYALDMKRLSKLCGDRGIFLVVDAVQIVGTRMIDLSQIPVDFLICGGHKHLMSLMGSGFVYVNPKTISRLKHFKVGIRSVEGFNSAGYRLRETASRFEDGTPNLLGVIALVHQVMQFNRFTLEWIEKKNQALLVTYKKCLRENGIPFIDYENQGNLIAIPAKNPGRLMSELEACRIYVKAIQNRQIRVAFSYLSRPEDIEKFVFALKRRTSSEFARDGLEEPKVPVRVSNLDGRKPAETGC